MNDNRATDKDRKWWQPLIALATVSIAGLGAWATSIYHDRQTQLQEMETVERFFPHLISEDPRLNAMARRTLKRVLKDKQLANELISDSVKIITEREATAAPSGTTWKELAKLGSDIVQEEAEQPPAAVSKRPSKPTSSKAAKAENEGWAYLGEYLDNEWRTRYFDFPDSLDHEKAPPEKLKGETLKVRQRTGALNVRLGMPTPEGEFPKVIDVLAVGVPATIKEVRNWQSTGYMWAKITYQQ